MVILVLANIGTAATQSNEIVKEVSPPGSSCQRGMPCGDADAESSAISSSSLYDLDQIEFIQKSVSASAGMKAKNLEFWEEHAFDHRSKITEDQRHIDNETVAQMAREKKDGDCVDDSKWRDADGDGCDIYKFAIESGKTSREIACSGGGVEEVPAALQSRLRGAKRVNVVADATARLFCPATCGLC